MAEETKKASEPVKTITEFKFNDEAVKDKLASLKKSCEETAGKKGYNPFLFFAAKLASPCDRYAKGERTKELQDIILALPNEVPQITTPEPDIKQLLKPELEPKGIKL